jgi:hypothetical protein
MSDERAPDHTEDPRRQETGQGGYPETNPAPAAPVGGRGNEGGGDIDGDAPRPATEEEADREHSTGNPGAAG